MNYPLSVGAADRRSGVLDNLNLPSRSRPSVSESALLEALSIVVISARVNGQSLEDLTHEILADDAFLQPLERLALSQIVAKAWEQFSG
jgi:hypothetical protein